MARQPETTKEVLELQVCGASVDVAVIHRKSAGAPIVFLHGFGSTKEDYADFVRHPVLGSRSIIAYDAPGCGETWCSELSKVTVPFLLETAKAVLGRLGVERFHLVGHSMGGLTSLILAHQESARVLSFIDIEGNVAPEDCFLSRQIVDYPADDPETFFRAFIERAWHLPYYSCPLYAASLSHKVRAKAVPSIFRSIVELSDQGDLMTKFLSLPFRRMFMYGEQNAGLSYLPKLKAAGVTLASISQSGHFPMYSNAVEMWDRIAEFHSDQRAR